jgi:YbbR domain-containing protein
MVRATVNINGLSDDQILTETLVPVDANGDRVDVVGLEIETAAIRLDMEQLERYRLVSVIPIIEGQELLEAEGYLVANVSVSPSQVIVFSSDAQALQSLPGFVETTPLDLASSTSDVQRRLALDLPEGISLVGDQSVLVQVDINPIEISITITRPIEFRGLGQGLFASASPDTVDIILKGPQPTLRLLEESDVRVILNLLDLVQGAHQILPEVVVSQTNIEVSAVQPESIEVTISDTPPPTASPSPLPPGTPEP